MKTWNEKAIVRFGTSVKYFNVRAWEIRISVDTKSAIDNKSYGFTPPVLQNFSHSKNSISLTYINKKNNETRQGLIETKTIIRILKGLWF